MPRKLVYTKNVFADTALQPAKPARRGTKRRRESALEAKCVKWARDRGVQVSKLTECVGIPDRIFFVPGGKPLIPEFKDPGGKGAPSPAQVWHVAKLKEHGYAAWFCANFEEFLREMRKRGVE
jgi:hypothetical protein